eukprot:Phypoly_transcript_20718.p1 GENE.Phypoly_transcript_20718~~Phypoly_transcript_20718.p1  ORF type:complete len:222 (-),score=56.97 Phypoly_transcript_20718:8-583(-)
MGRPITSADLKPSPVSIPPTISPRPPVTPPPSTNKPPPPAYPSNPITPTKALPLQPPLVPTPVSRERASTTPAPIITPTPTLAPPVMTPVPTPSTAPMKKTGSFIAPSGAKPAAPPPSSMKAVPSPFVQAKVGQPPPHTQHHPPATVQQPQHPQQPQQTQQPQTRIVPPFAPIRPPPAASGRSLPAKPPPR